MAPQAASVAKQQSKIALFNPSIFTSWVRLHVLFLLIFSGNAASRTIVKTLPGFSGELPFTLETGYVGVGYSDEVQLFYYFVESQRSPSQDPLMLWLTGGPGCSCLSAFFYESGPLNFDYLNYNGSLPTLHLNSYAWTQSLNIIYVDAPVGTGFSYSKTQQGYYVDDYSSAANTYQFLMKWLVDHPQFMTNQLYIGGDSYSGIPVPMIVQEIYDGNEAGRDPYMNLKGYVLGNPVTDSFLDDNSKIPFAHRMTLISDDLYEAAKDSCNGDFVNVYDATCEMNILAINEDYNYVLVGGWANDQTVREALNVRNGTKGYWARCNSSIAYTKDVTSTVPYHRNLTSKILRSLVYSGDHDMSIPHLGTQRWIKTLNMTLDDTWRAWFVDGQVAGYTQKYLDDDYSMVYATVKGAGHVAPEYKAKECYAMIDRFFANFPL
ncbi:hypothetical protein L1049_023249 [Liquidambar formosana]|uniref:Uncharacterized protein n=1 Tax=Liquidambar formosana TaxID=63359 RepID=A0AAP0REK0_LIQFO